MKDIVLITGATSGIGHACTRKFAENGYNLIITGRRNDRLNSISEQLTRDYSVKVLTLNFDVRDNSAVKNALVNLPEEWAKIDVLVNNAGLAVGMDTIQNGETDDWERMIDTNIKGLLYVTRAILPGMTERRKGHIINIGSIAGKEVYPFGNVYCATKHAVDALTKGIRIDTVKYGIKVTQIAPGAVETEFSVVRFKGDENRARSVYKGFEPLHPEDVAAVAFFATTLPAHANINDLVIMPTAQASATVINKE
ncbi:Oxidoreductase, short-chain dehydrogenase/reductase family [hydrothermal vent metagenome]|uniref:Oxidoreductase, short-chain dehydrogenase/reductase family n=1 Tax=hydrothermal vent metagenome TaxID=652676 RepID=A0A3B0VDT5_9ZZZZ